MTQTQIANNIQLHYLTGLPSRDNLYNDIASQPKGNLHLLLFSIAGFPYLNLPPWENDRLIVKTAQMLSEMLPEGAALYQWRDYSFAVLLPYYNLVFSQKWQNQVSVCFQPWFPHPPYPCPNFCRKQKQACKRPFKALGIFPFSTYLLHHLFFLHPPQLPLQPRQRNIYNLPWLACGQKILILFIYIMLRQFTPKPLPYNWT